MNQLSQATQQNASSSEELAATSEEMSAQAEQLQHAMSFFRLSAQTLNVRGSSVPPYQPKPPVKPMRKPEFPSRKQAAKSSAQTLDESEFVSF